MKASNTIETLDSGVNADEAPADRSTRRKKRIALFAVMLCFGTVSNSHPVNENRATLGHVASDVRVDCK